MKRTKNIIVKILIILPYALAMIWAIVRSPAHATEIVTEPITGNTVAYCNLSFDVTDATGSYDGQIQVIYTDIAAGNVYEYTLTKANSWGGNNIPQYSVAANTTYRVAFQTDTPDYTVVNRDGTLVEDFHATASGHKFQWEIVSSNTAIDQAGAQPAGTGNEEADTVFTAFLSAVRSIEDDPQHWYNYLLKYQIYEQMHAQTYADLTGGSADEWAAMSLYERFLRYETYIRLKKYISMSDYDRYFKNYDNFYANCLSSEYGFIAQYGTEEADAYLELMQWQYDYIKKHGYPFDFLSGHSFAPAAAGANTESEPDTLEDGEEIEMPENPLQEQEDETETAEEEKAGIWSGVQNKLKNNVISIVLIIVMGGAAAGMYLYRVRRNLEDTED